MYNYLIKRFENTFIKLFNMLKTLLNEKNKIISAIDIYNINKLLMINKVKRKNSRLKQLARLVLITSQLITS